MNYSLVFDESRNVGEWVAEQVEQESSWGDFYAMGVKNTDTGEFVAGVVFNNYNTANATCHIAVKRTGRYLRELLVHGYKYAFKTCGLNRLTGLVESTNQKALKLDYHMGFEHEFTMKKAGRDGADIEVLVLWPENFRYKGDVDELA